VQSSEDENIPIYDTTIISYMKTRLTTHQLKNRNIRSLKASLDEIRTIVASNEKQRFSLIHISAGPTSDTPDTSPDSTAVTNTSADNANGDDDPTHYLIRANQGHSIKLDAEELLTPITLEDPTSLPSMVVHGTRHDAWPLILSSGGLKPMTRNHVHFATGVPETLKKAFQERSATPADAEGGDVASIPDEKPGPAVLSGMRNSSTLLIYVDLQRVLEAGIKFWRSENGVVLSEGDEEKHLVEMQFFRKVEEKGGRVLVENGKVIADADEGMLERAKKGAAGKGQRGGRGGRGRQRGRGDKGGGQGRSDHGEDGADSAGRVTADKGDAES
jgi:2'-phosphotransferase